MRLNGIVPNVDRSLRMVALGDIMLGGLFSELYMSGQDLSVPYAVREELDNADIVIGNLEAPFSSEEDVCKEKKKSIVG